MPVNSLPALFIERMKARMDQTNFEQLMESFNLPRTYGLRINPLKHSPTEIMKLPFDLHPISWAENGYYYQAREKPGKHPYHAAGLYYIQEPSAMAVVPLLQPAPGEKILDLCAAPGGKSTHIAGLMQNKGLLVSNEIHPQRVKALARNLERLGVIHAVVMNESPAKLTDMFPLFFDKILIDAPCSGEGMFRKNEEAVADWNLTKVEECVDIQKDLLLHAAKMLKPGGRLVYSTCTFEEEENEQQISNFLHSHPQFALDHMEQLWPHQINGEGHFISVLTKKEEELDTTAQSRKIRINLKKDKDLQQAVSQFKQFCHDHLQHFNFQGEYVLFGSHLFLAPQLLPLKGAKVLKPGWHLGQLKKNRFEPNHALAMALTLADSKRKINFEVDDHKVLRYLQGESIHLTGEKGWVLLGVDGHPLGWGKQDGTQIKNHYPKGLRLPNKVDWS